MIYVFVLYFVDELSLMISCITDGFTWMWLDYCEGFRMILFLKGYKTAFIITPCLLYFKVLGNLHFCPCVCGQTAWLEKQRPGNFHGMAKYLLPVRHHSAHASHSQVYNTRGTFQYSLWLLFSTEYLSFFLNKWIISVSPFLLLHWSIWETSRIHRRNLCCRKSKHPVYSLLNSACRFLLSSTA